MKEIIVDKPIRMATFFLLLICIWAQISAAQTVGGRVADEKGHAISGVKVKVVWYDSPGVGYIYSYADRKAELTFAKSIVYVIL